jgi:hypothetical protein
MAQRTLSHRTNPHAGEDKGGPPYSIELETPVLLNSLARASPDKKTGSYTVKENRPTEMNGFADVNKFIDSHAFLIAY